MTAKVKKKSPVAKAKADPGLKTLLRSETAKTQPIEAVFALKKSKIGASTPTQIGKLVEQLVARAAKASGGTFEALNVFKNLGRFVVKADSEFILALLADPAIDSALANRRSEELLIRPKKKRPVA